MPAGGYYNAASYPLQLVLTPEPSACYDAFIYVQGQMVARARDDCEGSYNSVTAVVPPQANFYITESHLGGTKTVVTAMANEAKWDDTGIFFVVWSSYQQIGPCDPATHRMKVVVSEQQNTGLVIYEGLRSCSPDAMIP